MLVNLDLLLDDELIKTSMYSLGHPQGRHTEQRWALAGQGTASLGVRTCSSSGALLRDPQLHGRLLFQGHAPEQLQPPRVQASCTRHPQQTITPVSTTQSLLALSSQKY